MDNQLKEFMAKQKEESAKVDVPAEAPADEKKEAEKPAEEQA